MASRAFLMASLFFETGAPVCSAVSDYAQIGCYREEERG